MSYIRNKDTLYLVVRYALEEEVDKHHVVCAITRTEEFAITLAGRYRQEFLDKGITWLDFYVQAQTYYDE